MGKVRKGGKGRAGEMVSRKRRAPANRVIYCEKCGTAGQHTMVKDVGDCHGGIFVVEGRHWRWVTR